jgi:hypothetical protein
VCAGNRVQRPEACVVEGQRCFGHPQLEKAFISAGSL